MPSSDRNCSWLLYSDKLSSTTNCASHGTVNLLARPRKQLQRREFVFGGFQHAVLIAGYRMIRTPNGSCGNACLFVKLDDAKSISSSTFDHTDIKAETICGTMSTTDVDVVIAALEVTLDCRQACCYTIQYPAFLFETFSGNETNALCAVKHLSTAKFDFFGPQSTVDVHPIVPSRSLERLSRSDRTSCSFLILAPLS